MCDVDRADPGVFDDRIVFGQSAAFEGPAAALGLGMCEGILAAFYEANTGGGVNGRRSERAPARTRVPRRRVRAGQGDREHQPPNQGRPGLRPNRRGRHPDVQGSPTDGGGGARPVHRTHHGHRLSAGPVPRHRNQRTGVVRSGDGGVDRASPPTSGSRA